jgi:hypothetical protein
MATGPQETPAHGPLEGEDIDTEHWEDARHWMSIYDDLIRFKLGLLASIHRLTLERTARCMLAWPRLLTSLRIEMGAC